MPKHSNKFVSAVLFFSVLFQSAFAAETPPSLESFFSYEGMSYVAISPSGKYIAVAQRQKNNTSIIAVIDSLEPSKLRVVASESDDWFISSLGWVNDNRIYYQIVDPDRGQFMGAVDADGSNQKRLAGFKSSSSTMSGFWGPTHDGSNNIIAQTASYKSSTGDLQHTHLYKIDTMTLKESNWDEDQQPKRVISWLLDHHDIPRIASSKIESQCTSWVLAELPHNWAQLDQSDCFESHGVNPFFWESEQNLYVTRSSGGYSKLYSYDLKNHKVADQPLVDFKGFDFSGYFQYDYAAGRILGLQYRNDASGAFWFDPEMKKAQQIIDQKFPATINTIICSANCLSAPVLLITSESDQQPRHFYIYKKSDSSLVSLGSVRPHINPKQMGQRDFYRYKARDGMEIPVYVTQPPGPHQNGLPTVVIVHGGPWLRGASWEWEAQAQFLASRGYLVIEPQFRGSTGFGDAHFRAGFKQWGLAMQDDVTDAALWAAEKGWADKKRIGILGGSYGGYASLMGLIKTPEVFRCGVAFAAETDLNELIDSPINDNSTESQQFDMRILVGDPVADEAMFKANSPIKHAEAIRNPLLIMHGALDRRVPIGKASTLASNIKDYNKNIEWIVYDNEGHGLSHDKNAIDFWGRVETFLNKYLKPVQ